MKKVKKVTLTRVAKKENNDNNLSGENNNYGRIKHKVLPCIKKKPDVSILTANDEGLTTEDDAENLKQLLIKLGYLSQENTLLLSHQPEAVLPKQTQIEKKQEDGQLEHEGNSNIIRVKLTPSYIAVSRATYHNFRNPKSKYYKNDFPDVVVLGDNSKGHRKDELDAWLESRKSIMVVNSKGDAQ